MLFGMGAINLLTKGDLEAAERDFRRFREADTAYKFGPFHVWAEDELRLAREAAAANIATQPSLRLVHDRPLLL